ncbi:MAG: hotdog fold domain-containing protein [Syntrophomonadaceae bacterium]|jgi:acyl-coenzyme A thioesterase PaaI-like protein|nr:hotdog fold domain-containing protein [Bacillota bacterium]
MSQILELYRSTNNNEFTKLITGAAPYFSTIDPMFVELKPGYAEITVPNTKNIHNHMGTVHAIAMCNAAELVAGMMTEVSIPDSYRWIPMEMTVRYLAKAKTDLRVIAKGQDIDWDVIGETKVPVSIYDADGKEVFTAIITMKVSLKKQ